jgi:hypothetical protein
MGRMGRPSRLVWPPSFLGTQALVFPPRQAGEVVESTAVRAARVMFSC